MSKTDFLNLEVNGRLFPSWILQNFKKYYLEEIKRAIGSDPCAVAEEKQTLRKYQEFVSKFMDYRSPYKSVMLYHGLGSGKTATAIATYNALYNFSSLWNVFILIKATLENKPWIEDLNRWLNQDEKIKKEMRSNVKFIHYDSPFADRDFIEAVRSVDASKKSLFIIDEAHNFINNVYNNVTGQTGRRASSIYDYMVREKKDNDETRIILISATPIINNPFELALIFNLLRPGIFPNSELKFEEKYVSTGKIKQLNPSAKNMFQRRILGLASFYIGETPDLYAKKRLIQKEVVMSDYQTDIYNSFEFIEKQMEIRRMQNRSEEGSFMSYTRQSSNFVFPTINDKINGERRPRPNQFKLADIDAAKIMEGKTDEFKESIKDMETIKAADLYKRTLEDFILSTDKFFMKKNAEDIKNKHTIQDDIKIFKEKYNFKYKKFMDEHKNKSSLLQALYDCSCKMTAILFYGLRSKGPILVYSQFVSAEGLQMFKIYLKQVEFNPYGEGENYYQFLEYHGGIDDVKRKKTIEIFNQIENLDGKLVKYILIAPAGSEGISLRNIRQIHIMEPFWNETRIMQLIGRAIRQCYHKDLPMEERTVDVFRYKSVKKNGEPTVDEKIADLANRKQILIESFLMTVKEAAVDCKLFENHNMMSGKYQCFQFNESSLFDPQVGPAYNEDVYYDSKLNNGLNSMNSELKTVKVIKILGIKIFKTDSKDEGIKQKPENYWFNPSTRIVYDFELEFPIGRVKLDDEGLPKKEIINDESYYIIEELIDIPKTRIV
jgi:superfamily II DNA or RNA helicase